MAYSLIALQEMNLNSRFPSIYWATACLTVNSGASDEGAGDTTNYGKLSTAIGRIRKQGISVTLPNINKSKFSFVPDAENDEIIYGLKGMSEIGDTLIDNIIRNRPYEDISDFIEKVAPSKGQLISIIKGGCFDRIGTDVSRENLLKDYINSLAPRKAKLTLANVNGLITHNILPESQTPHIHLFNFNKYLKGAKVKDEYLLDERSSNYFVENFDSSILRVAGGKEYLSIPVWEKLYKNKMSELRDYIVANQEDLLVKFQEAEFKALWAQYCAGDLSTWEMEVLGFYYHEHELTNVYHPEFDFVDFYEENEIPLPVEYREYKGRSIPIYDFVHIQGTVLDKNSYKHTITLLTPTGVVNVKCIADHYSKYDKQISQYNDSLGRKEVLERSWFRRGSHLVVRGYRSQDQFMARGTRSKDTYPFYKILGKEPDGLLEITRFRADD